MADVELSIGGHLYVVNCADGEEDALRNLGIMVDDQIRSARLMAGGLSESRQLLFASILLAERLEAANVLSASAGPSQEAELLNSRAEALACRIEDATARVFALMSPLESAQDNA